MKFYDNQKFGRDKIIKLYRQLLEKLNLKYYEVLIFLTKKNK